MIIGIDTGAGDYDEAEHVAHTLPDVLGLHADQRSHLVVSTHIVRGEIGRDAVTVTLADDRAGAAGGPARLASRLAAAMPEGSGVVATWAGSDDAFTAGPESAQAAAWGAVAQAATRSAGRLVRYPGEDRMRGRVAVAELARRAGIDEVRVIGSPGPVDPTCIVDTRDFVRPLWQGGLLVLVLQPGAGGTLTPFEIEDPPRCCEDHRPRRT